MLKRLDRTAGARVRFNAFIITNGSYTTFGSEMGWWTHCSLKVRNLRIRLRFNLCSLFRFFSVNF